VCVYCKNVSVVQINKQLHPMHRNSFSVTEEIK